MVRPFLSQEATWLGTGSCLETGIETLLDPVEVKSTYSFPCISLFPPVGKSSLFFSPKHRVLAI